MIVTIFEFRKILKVKRENRDDIDNRYLELEGEHRRLRFVRDEKCARHGRRERYRDAGGKEPPTRLFLARPYSIEFDVERLDRGISRFIAAFTRVPYLGKQAKFY